MTKVQQRLAVDKKVDHKSPADAGGRTSEVARGTIFFALCLPTCARFVPYFYYYELGNNCLQMLCLPTLEKGYEQVYSHFVQYHIIILFDLQDNRSVRVRSSFKKTRVKVFWKCTTTFSDLQVWSVMYQWGMSGQQRRSAQ